MSELSSPPFSNMTSRRPGDNQVGAQAWSRGEITLWSASGDPHRCRLAVGRRQAELQFTKKGQFWQYQIETNGPIYQFTMFAADLGGGLTGMPVNFVRFQVRNSSAEPRVGFLASEVRVDPPQTYVLLFAG
jgi:hypothetical protein